MDIRPEFDAWLQQRNQRLGGGPQQLSAAAPGPQSGGAAQTPLHELVTHNIKTFEEQNKAPGFRSALKSAATRMRSYFDDSAAAKTIISKAQGENKRTAFQAKEAMKQFRGFANSLSMEDQLTLLDWIENPKAKADLGRELIPEAAGFVRTFRDWMQTYQRKLASLPQAEQMNFKEDFATHLWRRPDEFRNYLEARGGSNYFTKKRAFESPTRKAYGPALPRSLPTRWRFSPATSRTLRRKSPRGRQSPRSGRIGPIILEAKQTGERSAGNRRTQHADFPHCALLFASPQGLWDLSCRSGFRRWSNHSVAIEQLQPKIGD